MKFSPKKKTYIFVAFLAVILLYNSYIKTTLSSREGFTKNTNIDDINNKYESMKKIIAINQAEIALIKETLKTKFE